MIWLIGLLLCIVIIELFACYIPVNQFQKILGGICLAIIAVDSLLIFGLKPAVWSLLIIYFSVFRVINLVKLIDARKQKNYLESSFTRSALVLVIIQLVVLLLGWANSWLALDHLEETGIVSAVTALCLIIMALSLRRSLLKTRPSPARTFTPDAKLPSLSVAVPARNETVDLDECLTSLIASDYPKLEILVLDDCSQEKRTPEIIRQYAHDGVRFLAGKTPDESWTPKNYAYEQLAAEVNGEIILFVGVDTRFDYQTIRKMVELKMSKKKSMISFMPVNSLPKTKLKSILFQPVRYLWELAIPRRPFNRPPVLSTCWLIDKKLLLENGSFKAVSRSILPERYFARQAVRKNDGYSFICLGKELGLFAKKSLKDQKETAIRSRYPLLKQRIESVSFIVLSEMVLFILPIFELIYGLIKGSIFVVIISLINILVAGVILFVVTRLTYNMAIFLSAVFYPFVIAYDIFIVLYSMRAYEFGEVVWKGRNVSVPVMQIVTRFPTLSPE
jgi:chlorobactene glucosyltransferase